jgi:hypothetical protein
LEPLLEVGSYPVPALDGREWKYPGPVKDCPMILEPTILPLLSINCPLARTGNNT